MCPGVCAQPDELSQNAFILGPCIPVCLMHVPYHFQVFVKLFS